MVYNARAGGYTLRVALAWWSIGAPLGLLYTLYVHRAFSGKILARPDEAARRV
jgi:cytochrome bd-type quinol oxidase subunit 2